MPIRNPFARKLGVSNGLEPAQDQINQPAFERVDTVGSKASSAVSINSAISQEFVEYKLSVVNDSGVYLPPSPPDRRNFWPQRSRHSNSSTNTSPSLTDIEPFSISRESFDSYRRSFDISARLPVVTGHKERQSFDSMRSPQIPRSAISERAFQRESPTPEEGFEDVGLNDEQSKPKRRGFFSKFGETTEWGAAVPITSRFHITGRKRGLSGQGSELGSIKRPGTSGSVEVEEVH